MCRKPGRLQAVAQKFTAENLSVPLLYYVEAKLERRAGGLEAVRRQLSSAEGETRVRRILAAQLDVDDPQVVQELHEIPVAEHVDVSVVLSCDEYRTRLLDVALERLRIGPNAPALRIAPQPRPWPAASGTAERYAESQGRPRPTQPPRLPPTPTPNNDRDLPRAGEQNGRARELRHSASEYSQRTRWPSCRDSGQTARSGTAEERQTPGINFALVFGAETTLFLDTVLAFQTDEEACRRDGDPKVNVLGVHHTWLDQEMLARRALIVDHSRRACEVEFSEPQPIDVVETLHLPRRNEIALHRQISTACANARVAQVNPYEHAAERADDKMQTSELWRSFRDADGARVEAPLARLVPRGASREALIAAARSLLNGRATTEVVVQPNHGTEGWLVEAGQVDSEDCEVLDVAQSAERILPYDDVLIREARGNVRFIRDNERRRIAFRINVACDGNRFVAESGFAQVAPDATTFAASRGRGGEIVALDEALRSLCCHAGSGWHRFSPTTSDLEDMCAAATRAAGALNSGLRTERHLKHMGIDMVLEAHGSRVTPVLIEANARPAGLASSREIQLSSHGNLRPGVTTALFGFVRQQQRYRSRCK